MKQVLLVLLVGVVLAMSVMPVLALETGLEYGTYLGLGTKDLREGVMSIIRVLFGFLGILAILIVLYGGFTWMLAGGNDEKVSTAKSIISSGIIGLVIIFSAYAIAAFVITQLIEATGATA